MIDQYNSTNMELQQASDSRHFNRRANFLLRYLIDRQIKGPILDIGKYSPMTQFLEDRFGWIDNTDGDLDVPGFIVPLGYYETVLYLHTIEHQFNPLFTMLKLKNHIDKKSNMFVAIPHRPSFLDKGHFHKMTDSEFRNLCKRAGFIIISRTLHRQKKEWQNLFGVRPFIRYFLDREAIYELRLES